MAKSNEIKTRTITIPSMTARAESLVSNGILVDKDGKRTPITGERIAVTGEIVFNAVPDGTALYVEQPSPIGSGKQYKLKCGILGHKLPKFL